MALTVPWTEAMNLVVASQAGGDVPRSFCQRQNLVALSHWCRQNSPTPRPFRWYSATIALQSFQLRRNYLPLLSAAIGHSSTFESRGQCGHRARKQGRGFTGYDSGNDQLLSRLHPEWREGLVVLSCRSLHRCR